VSGQRVVRGRLVAGGGRKKVLFNQIKYFEVSCEDKGFPQK
jgi:hypothetical protein